MAPVVSLMVRANLGGTSVAVLNHPQSDAFRAARPDAGHALEFRDEVLDRRRIFDPLHDCCCDHSSCGMPCRSASMRRI
jgi:predicted dienelactone hydrolase